MLLGNRVGLYAIEHADLPQLKHWRNTPGIRKYCREFRELSMDQQERWYEESVIENPDVLMFAIRKLKNDSLLGCCGFNHVNWVHRRAEMSLYIGVDSVYIDDNGYAGESMALLLDYGFNELGLQRIWTDTYSFDLKKRELSNKMGFSEDGILRNNYWFDGQWWDSIVISILADDYHRLKKTD